ncbi:RNA polymerase [Blastocystis sp. subtype 4]|uniref:RNA polymerase n=1 Tax=Blastocystis sp. subtype 4 TaxID=944170 RepID=UPI0007118E97|nr:RNA polymerase [Blastocystis sp. subtype 4]KNB46321.1 RNA polymerase [Blastocystis sp. subtype 4]|eukprot:XP_014529762.1 RNA polymerase [Blastocystis sp. subtype 4]
MEEFKHIQYSFTSSSTYNSRITELTEDTLKFTLRGVDASIANGLRRIMIAEVPSVAIRTVTILENTSVLVDEYIAHRLGLIPIRRISDDPSTGLKDYFECAEECDRCTVRLTIDVTCRGDRPINVTSKDLKSLHPNYAPAHAASMEEAQANNENGIRIVALAPGQSLRVECKAILGVGKEHTKWSPVGTVSMKYVPIVTINRGSGD